MAEYSLAELEAEAERRKGNPTFPSVMAEEGTPMQETGKFLESTAKGGAVGLLSLLGGWGSYSDWRKQQQGIEEAPSPISTAGMVSGIKQATGVDLLNVPGYKGAYELGSVAAPTAAIYAVAPELSLFGRGKTAMGTIGKGALETAVGTGTNMFAQSVAPDSPLAQMLISASPYAAGGALTAIQRRTVAPKGTVPESAAALMDVGPMTPGQATGSRVQLATEARVAAAPETEMKPLAFKQAQAQSAESFLTRLFDSASSKAISDPDKVAETLTGAFKNYGQALATKLKQDANKMFTKAEKSGGMIDTQPVLDKLEQVKAGLRPDLNPADAALVGKIDSILESLFVPSKAEQRIPSAIVGETGMPLAETVVPATPAGANKISVSDLKRALSGWSDASWSGNYALNGTDVFAGVAPGQAKGVARAVLGGFKDALDAAIDSGVAGANDLKGARAAFGENLKKIDTFAKMPLTRVFGKDLEAVNPDEMLKKLAGQTPTQRKLLFGILQDDAPAIADTIRRVQFDRVLSRAAAEAASEDAPDFVIKQALQAMNKKNGDFAFLFPNAADATDARKAMEWMRKTLRSEGPMAVGGGGEYAAVRAVGGSAQAGFIAREVIPTLRDLVANPNAFANVIFDKDAVKKMLALQNRTDPQKVVDFIGSVGKYVAPMTIRSGAMLETTRPTVAGQEQPQEQGPSLAELLAEEERRKQAQ